jgi:hypothetical protein
MGVKRGERKELRIQALRGGVLSSLLLLQLHFL